MLGGCAVWEAVFGPFATKIELNDKKLIVSDMTELHVPRGNEVAFREKAFHVTGQEPVVVNVEGKTFTFTTDATGITMTRGKRQPQYIELPPGSEIEISREGIFFPETAEPPKPAPPPKKKATDGAETGKKGGETGKKDGEAGEKAQAGKEGEKDGEKKETPEPSKEEESDNEGGGESKRIEDIPDEEDDEWE
jgi:hypothetical protein